ncbi:sensor histidine kinase [Kitasatospora sp. MMS16-BH015]|uniref:sensor histidine kinase n=1 Tax=Kitasatospora sp. MMS16-BH015 TaxID=2018025 RepID=UPI000CA1C4F9|nr:sensor histidine kinase [Kitasatospora sp. MMS16-BH015]AUG75959.1 sensor histidine kinase [Kitasatospora sp. MMS16-BH015]
MDKAPWTRSDALVAVGAAAVDLLGYTLGNSGEGLPVSVPGCLLLVLAALPLLVRGRWPAPVLGAVLAIGAAFNLSEPQLTHFGAAPAVALYTAVRFCRPALGAAATVGAALVVLLTQTHDRALTWSDALSSTVAAAMVAVTAVAVRRWQQQVSDNRRLLAERAVAEERRRIARELHDIVAHHITTMQLMAGGARANLGRDPEVVREALVTLESSGRLALREMRQLLDVLRAGDEAGPGRTAPDAPQPGVDELGKLIEDSVRAGLPTELRVVGEARPLEPTLGLTVYRIVQEALTNTRKHAGRARAVVELTYRPEELLVEVRDDGAGGPPAEPTSGRAGYGLVGMKERVALHGGSLTAGPPAEGGYLVLGRFPLAPTAAAT